MGSHIGGGMPLSQEDNELSFRNLNHSRSDANPQSRFYSPLSGVCSADRFLQDCYMPAQYSSRRLSWKWAALPFCQGAP
jgi:hypothetical protein